MLSREQAWEMLTSYLKDDRMRKHCLAVEAIMRAAAKELGEDEELWGLVGLLHDIDYEVVGRDPRTHGLKALSILEGKLPRSALEAIAAHNENNGFRVSDPEAVRMCKALRAADHLSGLIVATALVMPNRKLKEVTLQSLKRKFKAKDFARGVDRARIRGCEELGLELDTFLEIGLRALQRIDNKLGL